MESERNSLVPPYSEMAEMSNPGIKVPRNGRFDVK